MDKLDLNDVQAFVQIIDICSRRGAFEGGELAGVGALRNKLVGILQEAGQEQAEQEAE